MPVAQSRGHAGKALLIAGVSVVILLAVGWLLATLANRGNVEFRLGDDRFDAGQVDDMADEIDEEDGLPLLFPDLVSGHRALFVQHTGARDGVGWVAFGAFDPDDPDCAVELDREAKILVNACDDTTTYPLDGTGLRYYPTEVDDGHVLVDINELSTTTTSRTG